MAKPHWQARGREGRVTEGAEPANGWNLKKFKEHLGPMSCECSKALRLMKVTPPLRRDGPEQPTEWGGRRGYEHKAR